MKKVILLAAVLAMSASAAFAQHFEWGAKAGLNLATQTKLDGVDTKMRVGLHVGVFGEYVVSDFFGVQGELLYSQMGVKGKFNGISLTDKTDYIVLPILAKLYVAKNLSVDLGPQFGYMISAKGGDIGYYDLVDKKFDVSFGMGLSYKINGRFDVTGRYLLGLTKLDDSADSKNGVIQLGVGYRF